MPGCAAWKEFYRLERLQLDEEGYAVDEYPTAEQAAAAKPSDAEWEAAYARLVQARANGLRPGFPFVEPNDFDAIVADAGRQPKLDPLTDDEYAERVRGAWFGRCAGVVLGKPLEINANRSQIRAYLEAAGAYPLADYVPLHTGAALKPGCHACCRGNIRCVEQDDDIHYTVLALLLVESKGVAFTPLDVCRNWIQNIPYGQVYSATKNAYRQMVNLSEDRPAEEQVAEFATRHNPMREGINGTIRTDFWGYIAPGEPRAAARLAHREASVNMVKNGLYACTFTAASISAALSANPTLDKIIGAGLSAVPARSRLREAFDLVTKWHAADRDWTATCDRIYRKYGHLPFAGAINNMCFVLLALLEGGLEFGKTIATAAMCGTDADCTAGTAGSIVGAAVGYRGIEPHWIEPFNDTVRTAVAGFGNGRVSELVARTIACRARHRAEVAALNVSA